MNHREFFNSMAEKWDTICLHNAGKINEILNLADIQNGAEILDVGTGTGVLIPFLVPRVGNTGKVTAVDIADKMIDIAKSKHSYTNVSFVLGDVFNLNLPEKHFDFIFCYCVFPHFENQPAAVEKLGKLLNPQGKIVICHSQSRDEINQMHKNSSRAVSNDYLPDADTISGYFYECGLDTIVSVDNERMFVVIGQKSC